MLFDNNFKYRTSLDVARNFQEMSRVVKMNVYQGEKEIFSFCYSLEKNKFLEFRIDKEVVEIESVRKLSEEDAKDLTHEILRMHGLHIDCSCLVKKI